MAVKIILLVAIIAVLSSSINGRTLPAADVQPTFFHHPFPRYGGAFGGFHGVGWPGFSGVGGGFGGGGEGGGSSLGREPGNDVGNGGFEGLGSGGRGRGSGELGRGVNGGN